MNGRIGRAAGERQVRRRIIFYGTLALWTVMLALLLRSVVVAPSPDRAAAPPAAARVETGDVWMGVYMHGNKIGYAHHEWTPDADGFTFLESSLLRLAVLGTPQTVRVSIRGRADRAWALRDAEFAVSGGPATLQAEAVVAGDKLHVTVHAGGERSEDVVPLDAPLFLPFTLRSAVWGDKVQAGREVEAAVFDPTSLKYERVRLRVETRDRVPDRADQAQAWRVRETFRGIESVAWIDDRGSVLREEGPLGLVMVRETPVDAVQAGWPSTAAALDVVTTAAVPVNTVIERPRELQTLRLRIRGIAADQVPTDAEQSWSGDVLRVARPDVERLGSYAVPYPANGEHADDLGATQFVPSGHPRLKGLVREIVGGETDARVVVRRLNQWVHGYLRKVPTLSIPSALQVLDAGEGDCNEHATLFTALSRTAGVPARLVAGAVYQEGAFYYHAWCEVWMDRWVSVDPTFGQFPADATHLKLVQGGPERYVDLMPVIGRLELTILPEEATAGRTRRGSRG